MAYDVGGRSYDSKKTVKPKKQTNYTDLGGNRSGGGTNKNVTGTRPTIHAPKKAATPKPKAKAKPKNMGNTAAELAASQRAHTRDRKLALPNIGKPAPPEPAPDPTFMDMLNQALQMTGDGGAAESSRQFSAQRSDLQSRGSAADASIAAMYKQLQESYGAAAPGIKQSYDQTGQGIASNGTAATANVNAAYDNSRQSATNQLSALGIGDAAGLLAGRGGNAQRDQERAGQDIAQATQGAQNQNTANGQAASTYNTEMGQVAGLTGAATRGRLQGSLSEKLANLTMQEQSSRSQSASSALAQAMQIANANMGEQRYNQDREDNLSMAGAQAAQEQSQFLAKQQQDTATAQGRAGISQQVLDLLAQNNIAPGSPEYARTLSAYTQMVSKSY